MENDWARKKVELKFKKALINQEVVLKKKKRKEMKNTSKERASHDLRKSMLGSWISAHQLKTLEEI